jgi:type 1 fimbriae regulatory protein FimE
VSAVVAGSLCDRPADRHDPTFPKEAVFGKVGPQGCRILRMMSSTSRRRQASFSGKSPPRKPKNVDVRPREYLSEEEVHRLIQAAKGVGRYGYRDATLILLTYRHGLRVSEVIALQWAVVDLGQGRLHVHRLKDGIASVHPLRGPEIRALRRLQRESPRSPYVFVSERGSSLTDSTARKIIARAGRGAGLEFPIHPHMLRHATGYKLANDGHDTRAIQHYLGHKNIQHTVRYTQLSAMRFQGFWRD